MRIDVTLTGNAFREWRMRGNEGEKKRKGKERGESDDVFSTNDIDIASASGSHDR